ncbi:MAG: DUF1292 domain-containing protein [Clostridia bacterium]|nr:DUF1292 domain-containing protein [Clostridia bacterium]MBQ8972326.1 DUF1292 domain-containing protein [Clostridia bacterium]
MDELDIIVFEDAEGNEIEMEIIDYLFYEGNEYVILSGKDPDDEQDEGVYVLQVVPIEGDEENEEFVPIDEALAEKVLNVYRTSEPMDELE